MYWPYENIDISDFTNRIHIAEELLIKNGAVYVKDHTEKKHWMLKDGSHYVYEETQKVYKYMEEFVRVDKVLFTSGPCLILEFSKNIDGPYEDADPFSYDLDMETFEHEIRFALGLENQ